MLSAAYAVARWVEYVSGALALIALVTITWRLLKGPYKPVLGPVCMLVAAGAICAGTFVFLGTAVQQVRLDSIKQLGLEAHHSGLRTNALVYDVQESARVALRVLPPGVPFSKVINDTSAYLVHRTTTVHTKAAVYGLINFATLKSESATVNRADRTIVLSLPNPTISQDTTYLVSVDGVQAREGPLTAVAQGLTGLLKSFFNRPVMSLNTQPVLAKARADALIRAQHSRALDSCGKEEIEQQLTHIFHLTPEYRDYALKVIWPRPPATGMNCTALQKQPAQP